jgi:hypothetical protein
MGMRDLLGYAMAIMIALLSQIVQPGSALWWAGMAVSGLIVIGVTAHLLWRQWSGIYSASAHVAKHPFVYGASAAILAPELSADGFSIIDPSYILKLCYGKTDLQKQALLTPHIGKTFNDHRPHYRDTRHTLF